MIRTPPVINAASAVRFVGQVALKFSAIARAISRNARKMPVAISDNPPLQIATPVHDLHKLSDTHIANWRCHQSRVRLSLIGHQRTLIGLGVRLPVGL